MAESFFNDPESCSQDEEESGSPGGEEEDERGGEEVALENKDSVYEYSFQNESMESSTTYYEGAERGNSHNESSQHQYHHQNHHHHQQQQQQQHNHNNSLFHSPSVMVEELHKSFRAGVFDGRLLAQTLIYLFKSSEASEEDINGVFGLVALLDDIDNGAATSGKLEFIEQLMFISQVCSESGSRIAHVIPYRILPLLVGFLKQSLPEVRKSSHATLVVLLEQGLVDRRDVEERVCPVILELTDSNHEYRMEATALLSKLAPLVGKEVSERVFLERFAELCSDSVAYVRQVCADNFGDFSSVLGPEATERVLLPKFIKLCHDQMWKIRKSCADEFTPVSCLVSSGVRRRLLSPLFLGLLRDGSQWVREAAFQSLGPFISTFVDPSIKALLQNLSGEMVISDVEVMGIRLEVLEQKRSLLPNPLNGETGEEEDELQTEAHKQLAESLALNVKNEEDSSNYNQDNEEDFNSFLYWKEPLEELAREDLPPELRNSSSNNNDNEEEDEEFTIKSLLDDDIDVAPLKKKPLSPAKKEKSSPPQNIVPQSLVDHFVGLVVRREDDEAINSEAAHHCCAFSFPAVALTLGRSNWRLLKGAYTSLAGDVHWKVRYILAASLYELGVILGEETAGRDLLPTCKKLMEDLDEVRIGILKHLADFIRLLRPELRSTFLPLMADFLSSYNVLNWRFREELALQLLAMVDIYPPEDVKASLAPVALALLRDKVSAVRKAALDALCRILKAFGPGHEAACRGLLGDLAESLGECPWVSRQTYAALSYQILASRSLELSQFALYVLPHLLRLGHDPVPNVRLVVARVLVDHICSMDYFNNKANPCHLSVLKTIAVLEEDPDADVVRCIAYRPPMRQQQQPV